MLGWLGGDPAAYKSGVPWLWKSQGGYLPTTVGDQIPKSKANCILQQSNNNMKNRNPPKWWTSFYINWLYYQHLPFGLPSLNPKTLVSLFPPCTGTIQGTQNVWPLELEWQQRQVKAVLKNSSKSPYFFRMWKKTTKDTHPGSTLQVISESIKLILFDIIPLRISFWSTACGFYQF